MTRPRPAGGTAGRTVLTLAHVAREDDPRSALALLAAQAALPRDCLVEAMRKGAVWHAPRGRKPGRLRRGDCAIAPGDRIELYYDSAVLALEPPRAGLLASHRHFSVWDKPAGLLVDGSRFGDHATLLRQAFERLPRARSLHAVHRLDLEASGLLLIAHSSPAAAKLSALFRARAIDKAYRVVVWGDLRGRGPSGRIEQALDGKAAVTEYTLEGYDAEADRSTVAVRMASGRYHQIRRHFTALGFPVVGDPKYARGRPPAPGMRLRAVRLAFPDPWTGESRRFELA